MTAPTDLAARYDVVRARTERLAAPLSPEDQTLQSMPSASPTRWHRAHTTWFFEEFVLGPCGVPAFDPSYRFLFNSYYEAVGPRHVRARRGMISRPSTAEVGAYRQAVDERMRALLAENVDPKVRELVTLGLNHEEQHQELLLTDILHAFHESPLLPAYRPAADRPPARAFAAPAPVRFVAFEAGLVSVGADPSASFGFDNEGPRHRVWLEPFALAHRCVTVGEVRAFVEDGGYSTPSLWRAEGYDRAKAQGRTAPAYLRFEGGAALGFTVDGGGAALGRRAGVAPRLVRGRRARRVVGRPAAHRGRVGARRGGPGRRRQPAGAEARARRGPRPHPALRRRLGVDVVGVQPVSGLFGR